MLLTSFEVLESLYPNLKDFNIEIKNINEENKYCFKNKYNENYKICFDVIAGFYGQLFINGFYVKDLNENFYNYKDLPAILNFKFFNNRLEEFKLMKNGAFEIKRYKFGFSNIDKMKTKKKLFRKTTAFISINKYGINYTNYIGDGDDVFCKIYKNYKLAEIIRCHNGKIGHPTKPTQVFFDNRGKVIKEIYRNPSTGFIEKVDGPAIITYNKIGKIQSRGYYLKGEKVTNPLELAILKNLS